MQVEVGSIVEGKVTGLMPFGAFVALEDGKTGLVHISEVADSYVTDVNEHLSVGQEVKVKVISIDAKGKMSLSIKKAEQTGNSSNNGSGNTNKRPFNKRRANPPAPSGPLGFEDMMKKFKQSSEEKMHDLKRKDKHGSGKKG